MLHIVGLETDPSAVFFPVIRLTKFTTQIPVTVKISAEFIQVMTVRKQEIMYGLNAVINDVCHICEIEEVLFSQHKQSTDAAQEFSFKFNRDNSIVTFSSPKGDSIVNVSGL